MAFEVLTQWVRAYCAAGGRSAWTMDDAAGVLLDVEAAWLIAIEWEAGAHTLHVYGNPASAAWSRRLQRPEPEASEDADEENGLRDDAGAAMPVDLSVDDTERRSLHVDPDTGVVSLSLVVPFAALSASAFEALIDGFVEDMDLWAAVFADDVLLPAKPSRGPDREGGDRIPWGAIAG